ncbi:MAG: HYR domain-containing protein [Lewinellaceae bacterium]|nr:HYR domain-containing protein [Saprospiraceae bacterium]MCB9333100.1 HYR domain-containing protein [Lewinellaceae bacterium]
MRILLTILLGLCVLQNSSAKRPFHTTNQSPTVEIESINHVSCNGGTDGAIYLAVQGQAPFTFLWSNGQKEMDLTDVAAGTYSVTVIDANNEETILENLTINEPPALNVALTFIQHITCLQPFGMLTAAASGGTPPYQYTWSNGDTGPTASPLAVGNYSLLLTDANSCTASLNSNITQNLTPPTANAGAPVTVLCSNAAIQLQGSGSTGAQFSQLWTAEDGGIISAGANTLTPTTNHTGTYVLTITNTINGCTASDATTVGSLYQAPAATVGGGTLTCAVNSIVLAASIDTLNTMYNWQGPNNFQSNLLHPAVSSGGNYLLTVTDTITGCFTIATATVALDTIHPATTASASGAISCASPSVFLLGWSNVGNAVFQWTGPGNFNSTGMQVSVNTPGLYTLITTNPQNGCSASKTISVTGSTTPPTVSATVSGQITCASPQVTLTGSVQPSGMQLLWTGPNGFSSNNLLVSVSTPGVYTLQATNPQNGCSATTTITVLQNKLQPDVSVIANNLSCAMPSTTLYANTSTPGLTFKWTGPNGFMTTVQNPTINTAGVYTVVATNPANGCTKSVSVSISFNSATPVVLTANATITCANPVAYPNATAFTPGATFSWTGPGGFTATGGSPAVTVPGIYTVVATHPSSGCTVAIQVPVIDNTQPPIAYAGEPQMLNCNNTPIILSGFGSSTIGSFSYLWTTYDGNILSGSINLYPRVNAVGTYTLQVTNNQNGCTAVDSVEVTQAPPVTATLGSVVHVACNGTATGSATAIAGGGNGPYTFGWSNGQTGATATGLSAGLYTVTVNDSQNCSNTVSVLINQPAVLVANTSSTPQTIFGVNNGTATVSYSGGTAPYSVKWNTGQVTSVITGLAPGTYTVTVTDSKGCTAVKTAQVNAVNCALTGSIANTPVSCFGAANGTATVNLNSSQNPVSYAWSNNAQTKTISNLAPATYTVTVTDGASCTLVLNTVITSPAALDLNFAFQENVLCPTSTTGALTIGVAGGTAPYTYLWSNNKTTASITGLGPGAYTVTVTDSKGCTKNKSGQIVITDQNPPQLILKNATASLNTNGSVTVTAAMFDNGSFDAECSIASWSITPTTFNCTQLGARTVTLTATDVNGNTKSGTATVTITDNIAPNLVCPANIAVGSCAATVQFSQPTVTDNCTINTSLIQQTAGLPSGSVFPAGKTIQIFSCTDASGNTAICSFEVQVAGPPAGSVTPIPAACSGTCDGSAVFISSGNTPDLVRWSNGQTGNLASNLCTGSYSVSLTDSYGCSTVLPFTIGSANNGSFEIVATRSPASCDNTCDGSSSLTVGGGTPPFQIFWSNGQSGNAALSLCAGAYSATVTDAHGCSQVQPVLIEADDNIPPTLNCPANITTSYCAPTVAYNQPVVQDNCTVDLQQLSLLGGLPSGSAFPQGVTTQFFRYEDSGGNAAQCSFTVTVLDDPELNLLSEDVNCAGGCDGTATVLTTGGYGPFSFKWNNGQQSNKATNLCPGNYAVTVVDAAGCSQTRQLTINQPQALALNILQVLNDVGNAGTGAISVAINGGTPPYAFHWTRNGQFFADVQNLQNLFAGNYQLKITDAQGCVINSIVLNLGNTVGTRENEWTVTLQVLPNPASDVVRVVLPEAPGLDVEVALFNPGGILAQREQLSATDTSVTFDVQALPAGLWLVHLRRADGLQTVRKLLVTH